jgi:hypothetical protein
MKRVQDSIIFSLSADEVVVNNTAKVVAKMVILLASGTTESTLKPSIYEILSAFIPGADFQIGSMDRSSHSSGLEQVTLIASTRIPESENYALDRRRETASRDGLRITSLSIDTSPTQQQLDETNSKLRLSLIAKAQAELALINDAMEGGYRISKITFDPESEMMPSKMSAANYGSGFRASAQSPTGGSTDDIGNAVKITMQAEVVLRRVV